MVNKKGWIRILEAFLAASFLLIVLFQVISYESPTKEPNEPLKMKVSNILFEIQSNESYRTDILTTTETPQSVINYFELKENCEICIPYHAQQAPGH